MRELTNYEKEKWFDNYNRFEMWEEDHFLPYGDEIGETFVALLGAVNCSTYLSDEFNKAAQIEILDLYYGQILHFYFEHFDEPEEYGLPSQEQLIAHAPKGGKTTLGNYGDLTDEARELWDWAMDWRREHLDEFRLASKKESLRRELERLENGSV